MIKRIWTQMPDAPHFVRWDIGYEIWELINDTFTHYRVLKRELNSEGLLEYLEILHESPIPLEAIRQEVHSWKVSDTILNNTPEKNSMSAKHTQANSLYQMFPLSQWIPASALNQQLVFEQPEQLSKFEGKGQKGQKVQNQQNLHPPRKYPAVPKGVPTGPLFI